MIPAFLRPASSKFLGPRPVVVEIHGGPSAQYRPVFDPFEDYLGDTLGITVIHPNIRGSTGYGRSYQFLDDGKLRGDAVEDIGALLDWIATRPDLDRDRVAISGASYGGFVTLASLVRFGDRVRAGVDFVGVSDIETFLGSARPAYLVQLRAEFGDERDPAMLEYLRSISPVKQAAKINRPLLVMHGRNDPRVSIKESDRIVEKVRANGSPTWYVRLADEGHGIGRREHAFYVQRVRALFLKRFLVAPPWAPGYPLVENPLGFDPTRLGNAGGSATSVKAP